MRFAHYMAAIVLVSACAAPALAQRKAKAPKPPKDVIVVNARAAVLTAFTLANDKGQVMAGLAKQIEPGKRAVLRLRKDATCALSVSALFDDEAENAGGQVDVCADKTIRLTD